MAGGWASALGAAILQGNEGFQGALTRQRAEKQRQFENDRQLASDKRAEEESVAQRKMQAIQAALLQDKVNELPKQHAEDDVKRILDTLGPETAFNKPEFATAMSQAGMPLQINPKVAELQNSPLSNEALAEDAGQLGAAPITGAQYPPEVQAAMAQRASVAKARNDLMSGKMGTAYQRAYAYEQAGGKNPPASLANDGANWVVEKITDPMTGRQYLRRVNKATGEEGAIQGGGSQGGATATPSSPDLHGEDFLKTVKDPTMVNAIKQLAQYKGVLPSGAALRSPYWQNLLNNLVPQYDPSFSAPMYPTRQKMMQDFTSGKTAVNIRAINTALAHLDQLNNDVSSLGNSNFEPVNVAKNYAKEKLGIGNVKGAKLDATAVRSELANAFKQSGATDAEIAQFMDTFSTNNGPNNQTGVNRAAVRLLEGRMHNINDQWTQAMGIPPSFRILSPQSQEIYDRIVGNKSAEQPVGPQQPGAAPAGAGLTYADYVRTRQGPPK
jgi:hypothetical protein